MKNLLFTCLFLCLLVSVRGNTEYDAQLVQETATSLSYSLNYTGSDEYYKNPKSPIIKRLIFELKCLTFGDISFKITDWNKTRFQIPEGDKFPEDPYKNFSFPISLSNFEVTITKKPFSLLIKRKSNKATIFSTAGKSLVFSQHYMEISTDAASEYIYGLGERFSSSFRMKQGNWTIFNRDRGGIIDNGTGFQTYGSFPVYMLREKSNLFHINYFRNSNPMDVVIESDQNNNTDIVFKTIGGALDFRIIMGEKDPENIIEKFHGYLGKAAIPPFWSLGYHQSRYGYKNITYLERVLQKFQENNLPIDTIWVDIDYLVGFEDFTIDQDLFPLDRLAKIIEKCHFIPIIEAGIKVTNHTYYLEGKKRNLYVKDAEGVEDFIGKVRGGPTVFVDFFHPNASQYWGDMLGILYQKVKFSGVWLDMNEYTNYCNGPCDPPKPTEKGFDYSNDLPYNPGADVIESHTLSLNSTHYQNRKQADVHNYAALLETQATNKFLASKSLSPFVLTRSSTLGSSRFGFHWTGDNTATFQFLKVSIADNFNNQIWGFQMIGSDICAYGSNATEELCARWFQVGSLYPFARNHNSLHANDQQPYAMGEILLKAAQTNLRLRYSLLKWYYSQFVLKQGRGSIFRPLFFEFPTVEDFYRDEVADTQFMIGSDLMSAPILQQGQDSRNVSMQGANWYDFHTGKYYPKGSYKIEKIGLSDPVPLFAREGSIIPMQNSTSVRNTKELGNTFTLLCALEQIEGSNNQKQKYVAKGKIISIQDYSSQKNVNDCLSGGCLYTLNITYTLQVIEGSKKFLEGSSQDSFDLKVELFLGVVYEGVRELAEEMTVDVVRLYYNGFIINHELDEPIKVKGSGIFKIPIIIAEKVAARKIISVE